jgi:hypothetical protein
MTDKDKKQLLMTGVLILVLIIMVIRAVKSTGKHLSRRITTVQPVAAVPIQKNILEDSQYVRLEKEGVALKMKRDPFFYRDLSPFAHLKLSGIAWDDENPEAIINGQIFQIGSHLGDHRIIDIQKDSVTISNEKETFVLRLGP